MQPRCTLLILAILVLGVACSKEVPQKSVLTTDAERFSYALGLDIGSNLKNLEIEVDVAVLAQAIRDTMEGQALLMSPEQATEVREEFANTFRERQEGKAREMAAHNLEEGTAFLEANKGAEGVITTASGLQYLVVTEGAGPRPTDKSTVKVHYRGTLIDGTEFDSSHSRGEPATFRVGGVIPGWVEALQLMPVGSTYRLFIPPHLAYGERGAGSQIGPNATLVFEVELLSIEG
ncbi:FKBP-type peptidyl-prolyl cis-trans isomerase [Candidatus Fermentibacteria bacterium]|nr:FKBP-type peptidyl-prolyl cis-trans isomerase [Candidatus Fermentibacteria bacterium]